MRRALQIVVCVSVCRSTAGAEAQACGQLGSRLQRVLCRLSSVDATIERLRLAVADADPIVRQAAIASLARRGVDALSALPALTKALDDPQQDVRAMAATAIGKLGPAAYQAARQLVVRLSIDPKRVVRIRCAEALTAIGPKIVAHIPQLYSIVRRGDPTPCHRWPCARDVRLAALGAAQRMGQGTNKAVPLLAAALSDSYFGVRLAAARGLATVGREARETLGQLLTAATDRFASVRQAALLAIGTIFGRHLPQRAVARIGLALSDRSRFVRAAAARSLWRARRGARPVLKQLIGACRDRYAMVRLHATQALGRIGPAAKPAIITLRRLAASDSSVRVRKEALRALRLIRR